MSTAHRSSQGQISAEALDFSPGLLSIQERPPARMPRAIAYAVCGLVALLLVWSLVGQVDIVASAEGKLVPQSYVKIVQPADAGIVKEILVNEGEQVRAGQVLMRLDPQMAHADEATVRQELAMKSLQLRRIDAELGSAPLSRGTNDSAQMFQEVAAQFKEHKSALADALAQASELRTRAAHDAEVGRANLVKLQEVIPILRDQARSLTELAKDGYVPHARLQDKQREYLEKTNELKAQQASVESLDASRAAADRQVAQILSKYRSDLQNERVEAEAAREKLTHELTKQEHRRELLELRAPQGGIVKDVATHTIGTVVSAGTVLMSIVPEREPLIAEVMVKNDDIGFVFPRQSVKIKLAAYPFEQYGMVEGTVTRLGPDANDESNPRETRDPNMQVPYKAIVALDAQQLVTQGRRFKLVPGMRVTAEIHQGHRSVAAYLLSPVRKVIAEAGRER
jgi:HlyD family secretion protein